MKVTDERLQELIKIEKLQELNGGEFWKKAKERLSTLEELQLLRKIDIPHTLKYAEEAGATCEKMKHGIESVIIEMEKKAKRVVNKYSDDELSFSSGLYESITIIENHLSKYLDE